MSMEETPKKKRNRFYLFRHHLHNESNDISYRGPLSYRHLRIIAWVCMMFMALSVLFSAFAKSKPNLETASSVFQVIGSLALPLFLVANFSHIMRNRKNLRSVIKLYGLAALGMMFVAFAFAFRYYFTIVNRYHFDQEYYEVSKSILEFFLNMYVNKFVFLNVFIDLFLCSIAFAFLTYTPKKFFKGKKIILFRLLVLLPVAYEIACVYLKLHCLTSETFMIPWYIFPLLTTKPPMLLLSFLILTIIIVIRKRIYMKKNNCSEHQYEEFLKTNANSLHFSIITVVVLLVAVLIDILVYAIVCDHIATKLGVELEDAMDQVYKTGLGATIPVVFTFPIIILFSYSRDYKDKIIDKIIPAAGVSLCILAAVEAFVQLLST